MCYSIDTIGNEQYSKLPYFRCKEYYSSSIWDLGLSDHTEQLADGPVVIAVHALCEAEVPALVYRHVGLVLAGFEIARHLLAVGLVGDGPYQQLADSLTLGVGVDDDDVEEVVAPRIDPESRLSLGLCRLEDVVALSTGFVSRPCLCQGER